MHLSGFFDALKDSSVFGVFVFQEEGKIVFLNKRFAEILGYSDKDEILGKSILEFISPKYSGGGGMSELNSLENIKNIIKRRTQGEVFPIELKTHWFLSKTKADIPVSVFAYTIEYNKKSSGIVLVSDRTKEVSYQKLFFALSQINQLIVRIENKEDLLREICDILVDKVGYTSCAVGYIDETSKLFIQKYTRANTKELQKALKNLTIGVDTSTPHGAGSASQAYHAKKISIIEDVLQKAHMSYWQDYYSYFNIHSVCSIPIMQNNQVKYILYLNDTTPNSFHSDYLHLLEEIQLGLSFALDRFEKQKFLQMTQLAIDSGFEFVIITDENFNIIYANDKALSISDYTKEELLGAHHSIFSSKTHTKEFAKNFYKTLKNGAVYSNFMKFQTKSGKILDFYVNIVPFKQDGKITNYISIGKLIDEKNTIEQLEKILYTDPVTNLPNYRSFQSMVDRFLKRALSKNTIGAVAVINPISFSSINQAFGFEKANEVLRMIGERLRNILYSYDVIAKLESDRFGLIIKDLKTEEDLLVIVSQVLSELSKPYTLFNQSISISFNIGLSLTPKDAATVNELIDKANIALQDAKENGENQIGFFRKDIEEKAFKKLKLKADLERAILNKKFIPFYQPYVDKNKQIVGAEALMRWKKDNTIVSPAEFINYLEETNLIIDAENQLTDSVLKDLKELEKHHKDIPISINLSALSLNQKDLVQSLSSLLNYYNLKPNSLKIEIVERVFFKDFAYMKNLIEELRELGVHFSIDDFGTHYSSLNYLSELDVSFLKIDISFVRKIQTDPKTKNLVAAIIYLAHSLNIKTIAEGVEAKEQFEILKTLDCDYFQGYLFYKPMPKLEFFRALR
ncbi:diguanylate cyclase/phosphodiesterase (GGDEF / EAL domains) with PAS/PAC sensor(s) [Desulfurella amilsii]|uniref:Diguanylate cyclase/phosphodiesterase (GGDEF / EAL domains) with PAS/PAC sensor(S) n=2 Tax=Desulfurella amilsii TaxID=1562698 RepID=A0A1X4XU89_9BACT|nr:diguanylate cyclase/phosphodiesterase (GGDEF / EAL domains) with PAS/PAC sensor(s) [Desulfurella amilsii]